MAGKKRKKQRKATKRLAKLIQAAVDQAVFAALDAWLDQPVVTESQLWAGPGARVVKGRRGDGPELSGGGVPVDCGGPSPESGGWIFLPSEKSQEEIWRERFAKGSGVVRFPEKAS